MIYEFDCIARDEDCLRLDVLPWGRLLIEVGPLPNVELDLKGVREMQKALVELEAEMIEACPHTFTDVVIRAESDLIDSWEVHVEVCDECGKELGDEEEDS